MFVHGVMLGYACSLMELLGDTLNGSCLCAATSRIPFDFVSKLCFIPNNEI